MHLKSLLLIGIFYIFSSTLYAGIIYMDDTGTISLINTGKNYYFPESHKQMPDKYHHMFEEGTHKICYKEINREAFPQDLVVLKIKDYQDEKGIVDWFCYEE